MLPGIVREWAKRKSVGGFENTVLDVDFGQIGQEFADPENMHNVKGDEELQRQKTEEEMASFILCLLWFGKKSGMGRTDRLLYRSTG
ncbi:MAG: hypothetical protein ACLU30_11000 [Odoribacter splanchnicus]